MMVSSAKMAGHEKKHERANRTKRYLAGAYEVEGELNLKLRLELALILNDKGPKIPLQAN